jgi:hypothetical protein
MGFYRAPASVKPASSLPDCPALNHRWGGNPESSVLDSPAPPAIFPKAKDIGIIHFGTSIKFKRLTKSGGFSAASRSCRAAGKPGSCAQLRVTPGGQQYPIIGTFYQSVKNGRR